MTQLTFNVKQFNIIKITSFFANYERNFNLFDYKESSILKNATKSRIKILKKIYNNIMRMQIKSSNYVNKKQKNASLLKEENKMYLFTKNLKRKNESKKLNSIKVEIFFYQKGQRI